MKPREKILNFGTESLSDRELLMLIIGSGVKGASVEDIADSLLLRFGSLGRVLSAPLEELVSVDGIGLAISAKILAVGEVVRRLFSLNMPEREYLFIICKDGSVGWVVSGDKDEVSLSPAYFPLPCSEVFVYHYHTQECMPSVSDEWLLSVLKDRKISVIKYEIITSYLSVYDVLSKVDRVKGELP